MESCRAEPADERLERTSAPAARKGRRGGDGSGGSGGTGGLEGVKAQRRQGVNTLPPFVPVYRLYRLYRPYRPADQSSTTIRYFDGAQNSSGDSICKEPRNFLPSSVSDDAARNCGLWRDTIL